MGGGGSKVAAVEAEAEVDEEDNEEEIGKSDLS